MCAKCRVCICFCFFLITTPKHTKPAHPLKGTEPWEWTEVMPLRGQIYAHLTCTLKAVTYAYYIIITAFNTLCLHVESICDSRGNSAVAQAVFFGYMFERLLLYYYNQHLVSMNLIQYHTIRIQVIFSSFCLYLAEISVLILAINSTDLAAMFYPGR